MTSLIYEKTQFHLTPERLNSALEQIKVSLKDRVLSAYIFGSAAGQDFRSESDIDLILIVREPKRPFIQRAFDFLDLFEIYPKLDILVYTPEEFQDQLRDSEIGFWKSVRESLVKIV